MMVALVCEPARGPRRRGWGRYWSLPPRALPPPRALHGHAAGKAHEAGTAGAAGIGEDDLSPGLGWVWKNTTMAGEDPGKTAPVRDPRPREASPVPGGKGAAQIHVAEGRVRRGQPSSRADLAGSNTAAGAARPGSQRFRRTMRVPARAICWSCSRISMAKEAGCARAAACGRWRVSLECAAKRVPCAGLGLLPRGLRLPLPALVSVPPAQGVHPRRGRRLRPLS